ncbi:MAG: extracellular solute-binding protein [Clostridia bacterium]|nr:extracellular solute-binding protein [Clostridia bacterium]
MKKSILTNKFLTVIALVISILVTLANLVTPIGKTHLASADSGKKEITIFSWEDYIDLGYSFEDGDEPSEYLQGKYAKEDLEVSVIDLFMQQNPDIKVNYYSFATNEEMYNELLKDPYAVDIICPSEYMIMKMKEENLIQPYSMPDNYVNYGSPYIKGVFEQLGLDNGDGTTYAIGYMWGTMGLIYNAEKFEDSDFTHWSNLFDEKFKNKITIKDSLRDSYIMAVAIVHEQELLEYKEKLASHDISEQEYTNALFNIFNDVSPETVDKVRDVLVELKRNLYGFEVDAGKNDLLTGKIDVNFAWSGDAVYSMWEADEAGKELRYVVPEEGSNVWFDGWVMTKNADVESSRKFLDFVSDPAIAVRNIDYVGYTSCIAGDTVFEYVTDNFGDDQGNIEVDLSYFFGTDKDYKVTVSDGEDGYYRHLYAQYADEPTILRCAVMDNFSPEDLQLVNEMWSEVKLITLTDLTIILIVVGIVLIITAVVLYKYKEKIFGVKISDKERKIKKGLKIVNKENII